MDRDLLDKVSSSEFRRYLNELEQASDNHARWLARVNRSLVCHCAAHEDDLAEAPHTLCHFGRWYDSIDSAELRALPEFTAIAPVHEAMHAAARELLLRNQNGDGCDTEQYDRMVALTDELRRRLTALRERFESDIGISSLLMGKVFENAAEGVIITAPDGTILNVNHAFTRVTGYSAEEALGNTPHMLYSGRQDKVFYEAMWQALEDEGQWQGEIWNRRKDGSVYPEYLSIVAVRNEAGETSNYVGIFSDISAEKENEERLYRLAHFDLLTGLPNRILFQDRLHQALLHARRAGHTVAVMFMDLDGFKAINDELGHNLGDTLLQLVAGRLIDTLRDSDTVGRFGGDEFTVVLPQVESRAAAAAVAEKLVKAIAEPYLLDGQERWISTSVGICLYPEDSEDADLLIERADAAMYYAKHHGKNRYQFYTPDLG